MKRTRTIVLSEKMGTRAVAGQLRPGDKLTECFGLRQVEAVLLLPQGKVAVTFSDGITEEMHRKEVVMVLPQKGE